MFGFSTLLSLFFFHFNSANPFLSRAKLQCLQLEIRGDTIQCTTHYFEYILRFCFCFCVCRQCLKSILFRFFFLILHFHLVHGELILGITINGKCVDGWIPRDKKKTKKFICAHTIVFNITKTSYSVR